MFLKPKDKDLGFSLHFMLGAGGVFVRLSCTPTHTEGLVQQGLCMGVSGDEVNL